MRERYPHFATLSEARTIYVLTTEMLIIKLIRILHWEENAKK